MLCLCDHELLGSPRFVATYSRESPAETPTRSQSQGPVVGITFLDLNPDAGDHWHTKEWKTASRSRLMYYPAWLGRSRGRRRALGRLAASRFDIDTRLVSAPSLLAKVAPTPTTGLHTGKWWCPTLVVESKLSRIRSSKRHISGWVRE